MKHWSYLASIFVICLLLVNCWMPTALPTHTPAGIDTRDDIADTEFVTDDDSSWVSPWHTARFPFDELIYSWQIQIPEKQGFRLYLQVTLTDQETSPWLYAGYWGDVDKITNRERPRFEHGYVAMDDLFLQKPGLAYRFKVVDEGKENLSQLPSLRVICINHNPEDEQKQEFQPPAKGWPRRSYVLDIPLRLQIDSQGTPRPSRCQSAAMASALQFFGQPLPLEDIIAWIYDTEYGYPGLWPRIIGFASQQGYEAYIERFQNWNDVLETLQQGKIILCSIRLPEGEHISPPYPDIGNHIVVLNGITKDGRVVVTDSALRHNNAGYLCQWLHEDFETAWFVKAGIAMVICPPEGFQPKMVREIPPFPRELPSGYKLR